MRTSNVKLSERQQQIARLLIQGLSPKEIARVLNLAVSTVREHQNVIKKRLSCKSSYEVGYKLAAFLSLEMNHPLRILCINPYF